MSADLHPLRLRRTLPGAGHLLDLEARAAGRDEPADPAARDELLFEIGRLMPSAGSKGAQASYDEAVRLSKVLQWAKAGSMILSAHGTTGEDDPQTGIMRVGDIRLPRACLYLSFATPVPTPRRDMHIEGVYLGEGGPSETVAAGWVEYVWALPIVSGGTGPHQGSACCSPRCEIGTADPSVLVEDCIRLSLAAQASALPPADTDDGEWSGCLAAAVELALRAASHACTDAFNLPQRKERCADDEDEGRCGTPPCVRPPVEILVAHMGGGGDMASYLLGAFVPRVRHRWPEGADGRQPRAPFARRSGQPLSIRGPLQTGYERSEHDRTYRRGRPDEYTKRVMAHPVKGGSCGTPKEVVVRHLEVRGAPATPRKERTGQSMRSMPIVTKD